MNNNLILYEIITKRDRNSMIVEMRPIVADKHKAIMAKTEASKNICDYAIDQLYEYKLLDLEYIDNKFVFTGGK